MPSTMRVLVIDDDEELRRNWFKDVWSAFYPDWDLHLAFNSVGALAVLKTYAFDLVFFDHDLGPGSRNGSEIAFEILSNPEVYNIPKLVWVHSGNPAGVPNIVAKFRSAGVPVRAQTFERPMQQLVKDRPRFEKVLEEMRCTD
jgi:CheY-like chemotaxis protein